MARVLGIALLLRVAVVWYVFLHLGPAWFFSRGSEMGFIAHSLVHGQGLSSPFGVNTGPTAIVAPGYPLLVAVVFHTLGEYTRTAALWLMLFHVACNIGTVYLIYRLARTFADERSSAIVAMFWACSLPLLWMPTIFWETSISCTVIVGIVQALLLSRRPISTACWAAYGVICGVAGLTNPALLACVLAPIVYTLLRTSPWRKSSLHLAALVASLTLVMLPWPIRNAYVFHTCVLTRTTMGLELWMGNHPGSTGFLLPSVFPTNNVGELASYQSRGEVCYTTFKGELARAYISAHPAQFALLSVRRFWRFWTGTGTEGGSILFALHASLSSLLGLSGTVLLWQRGNRHASVCAGLVLLLFPLPYYITHAEFRYRLVLDPLLTALAAPVLQRLLTRRPAPFRVVTLEKSCEIQY